jgi:hypothetical protein
LGWRKNNLKFFILKITVILTTALIALTVFISDSLDAMSWPSESADLIRNFGANDRGKPVLGMVFSGETGVFAAEKGEVIFSQSKNNTGSMGNDVSRLPSPLGAWTAVDHGDGLISIYSRCKDGTLSTYVEKNDRVASSGISGWSSQEGFYFLVYDRRERRWVNPAMIITPQTENRPPQILSVELRNAQGVNVQPRDLNQGQYTILVNATTAAPPRGAIFAPQRIVCSVNGAEVGFLNFEAISARDGILMAFRNGLVPAKQIYDNAPFFEAANVFLSRGQANLEVIVQDVAGNSRSFVNRMIVN